MYGFDPEKRILDFPSSLTPDDCLRAIEILTSRYAEIVPSVIGKSILSRDIPCLTLGRGSPSILWVGAQSAADSITSSLLLRFLNEYCELMKRRGQIYNCNLRYLHELRRLQIVPMLNPDGISFALDGLKAEHILADRIKAMNGGESLTHWKANARGVDLRKNYAADAAQFLRRKQEALVSSHPGGGAEGWCGEAPESEPESAALARMLRRSREIGMMIDLRKGEARIEYAKHADRRSTALGQKLSRLSGIPLAPSSGDGFCDWAEDELHLPTFTLFCGEGNELFDLYAAIRELLFVSPTLIGR